MNAPDGIVYTTPAQDVLEEWFDGLGIDMDVTEMKSLFDKMTAASMPKPPVKNWTGLLQDVVVDILEERRVIAEKEQNLRDQFERYASDSHSFSRSRKGTYTNSAVARDWKWFQLGANATKLEAS